MESPSRQRTDAPRLGVHYGADNVVGLDGLLIDGVDPQAAWRAHLRELTTARQAVERQSGRVYTETLEEYEKRRAQLLDTLARIDEEHQAWLRIHRPSEVRQIPGYGDPWVSENTPTDLEKQPRRRQRRMETTPRRGH